MTMVCPPQKPDTDAEVWKAVNEMLKDHREQQSRDRSRWLWRSVGLITLVSLALLPFRVSYLEEPRRLGVEPLQRVEVAEGGLTDGVDASVLAIGVPMPEKPLPNWKKPPCASSRQHSIKGACWIRTDEAPGGDRCGEFYEHDGKCYAPVTQKKDAPLSLERER
jgi:hypothetical protein